MAPSETKLDWLQALRGVAAIAVVLTHARRVFLDTPFWEGVNYYLFPFACGVDLFFVISGFIMVYTTTRREIDASTFMAKRFIRVWPAYFCVSLVSAMLAGGLLLLPSSEAWRSFLLSVIFIPVSYDLIFGNQVIPQGWTLNFEAYFYVIFGASLLFGRYRWLALGGWFATTLIFVPLTMSAPALDPLAPFAVGSYPAAPYLRIACNPVLWEFIGGMGAAGLYFSTARIRSRRLCYILIGLATIVAVANTWYAYHYISLSVGWAYVLLIGTLAVTSKTVPIRPTQFFVYAGDLSYTLYLIHMLIIETIRLNSPVPRSFIAGLVEFAGVTAVSILAASVLSPLIERKLPRILVRGHNHPIGSIADELRPPASGRSENRSPGGATGQRDNI